MIVLCFRFCMQSVKIFDVRSNSPLLHDLESLHNTSIHTVAWRPGSSQHHLLTTSFDSTLRVVDLRYTKEPCLVLNAHWPKHLLNTRADAIRAPTFAYDGNFIVASSSAQYLTIYDANLGTVLRKVNVGFAPLQLTSWNGLDHGVDESQHNVQNKDLLISWSRPRHLHVLELFRERMY